MRSLYVNQQIRPVRFCFLIGKQKANLLEAIVLNTILWGGIYNPIIKLNKSSSKNEVIRSLGVIKDFDPDLIINLSALIPKSFVKKVNRKILTKDYLFSGNWGSRLKLKRGLDTYRALNWEMSDFGLTDEQRERFRLINSKKSEITPFLGTIYGLIDKSSFPLVHEYLTKQIRLRTQEVTSLKSISRFKHEEPISVIGLTRTSLNEFGLRSGFARNLIFIGNTQKVEDLVEYWNIRAAGINAYFLPMKDYVEYESAVKSFIESNSVEKRFNRIDIEVQIAPSVKEKKDFEAVADWISKISQTSLTRRPWVANWGRRSKRVSQDVGVVIPYHSRDKTIVSYSSKEIESFSVASPRFMDDSYYRKKDSWAIDLSFIGFYERDYTIDLPNQNGMQEIAERELIFSGYNKVRVSDRGLVVLCDSKDDTIHVDPVPTSKVVKKIFEKAGFDMFISTPGIFSNKILQIAGGLEGCRVFKVKGVREALTKLNTSISEITISNKRHRGRIARPNPLPANAIQDIIKSEVVDQHGSKNWINKLYEDLVLEFSQGRPLTPAKVVDYLIKTKIIVPGLKLKCNECSTEEWYRLGSFTDTFKCSYCFAEQDIPRIDQQHWSYRTEGMISIADEGRGSLPVILSLWRLSHNADLGEGKFITSHNIESKDGKLKSEIDYIFYTVGHFEKDMELVIGEARNYSEYTEKDIKKTISVARRLTKKPYIAFTTLKDEFNDKEKKLLKGVIKAGFSIIPLTRMDVDPYDLYDRFRSKGVKDIYAVTLDDLSFNLCEVNLGMKPRDVGDLLIEEIKKKVQKSFGVRKKLKSKKRNNL